MLPAFCESGHDHREETSSLLDPVISTHSSKHQTYDSTEQGIRENHGVAHDFELQHQDEGHRWRHKKIKHAALCTLIVAAAVVVFMADSSLDDVPDPFPWFLYSHRLL